jgi:hypothetical protein
MKAKLLFILFAGIFSGFAACAQLRPSPAASVSETTTSGVKITIDYSQPGVKGRKIFGVTGLQPYGTIWRAGANEITLLEVSKDAKLEGKPLPAGKYGLFAIPGANEWTIIVSKKWEGSGAEYPKGQDLFRVKVKPKKAPFTERLVYKISKSGVISLIWENTQVDFAVK